MKILLQDLIVISLAAGSYLIETREQSWNRNQPLPGSKTHCFKFILQVVIVFVSSCEKGIRPSNFTELNVQLIWGPILKSEKDIGSLFSFGTKQKSKVDAKKPRSFVKSSVSGLGYTFWNEFKNYSYLSRFHKTFLSLLIPKSNSLENISFPREKMWSV